MAWLKQLALDTKDLSLRALAKLMHDEGQWPDDASLSFESFANKLRDLDKGKGLGWWDRRGAPFRPLLAEVLKLEESELERRMRPASVANDGAMYAFNMFTALRPLHLDQEGLMPGIPGEIARSGGPAAPRTWWVAPPGAGKTLAGRWLERRSWHVIQAGGWPEALREMPSTGHVFLELSDPAEEPTAWLKERAELRLCVATPGSPSPPTSERPPGAESPLLLHEPHERAEQATDWRIVETPPASAWMERLIDWAAQRVTPGGGFDASTAREGLCAPENLELFDTPGDALAFLGVIDEAGWGSVNDGGPHQRQASRWVRAWLKLAADRSDRKAPPGMAALLRKEGADLLTEMATAALRQGVDPAGVLPAETWTDLVPPERAPPLDRDALLQLAVQEPDDLATKLRDALRPDPETVIQGLRAAGLLHADGDGYRLGPRWLTLTTADAAFERLAKGSVDDRGTLLLYESTAERLLRRWLDEVLKRRPGAIEAALCEAPQTPEQCLVLEGAFRIAGLAALIDPEAVPVDLARRLWARMLPLLRRRWTNWPPVPVLLAGGQHLFKGLVATHRWFTAALALAWIVRDNPVPGIPATLDPWAPTPLSPEDQKIRDSGQLMASRHDTGDTEPAGRIRLGLYRLGGVLLEEGIRLSFGPGEPDIQHPDLLVRLGAGLLETLPEDRTRQLLRLEFGLPALREACQRNDVELSTVVAWCWRRWSARDRWCPPLVFEPRRHPTLSVEDAVTLWTLRPSDAHFPGLLEAVRFLPASVWPVLPRSFWQEWVYQLRASTVDPHLQQPEMLSFIPEDLLLPLLLDELHVEVRYAIPRSLWARCPERLLSLAETLGRDPDVKQDPNHGSPLSRIVSTAPGEHTPELVRLAETWLEDPGAFPGVGSWLTHWLLHTANGRALGWREAFALVMRVDGGQVGAGPGTG
ncbi:MAG: hypothetical protein H6739_34515 [Alphaproteobacteria bacterium]|nr:hypothetical protein [Alphaproteobacteria bacterium]